MFLYNMKRGACESTPFMYNYMAMHFVLCHDAQTSTSPCNFKDIGSFKKSLLLFDFSTK